MHRNSFKIFLLFTTFLVPLLFAPLTFGYTQAAPGDDFPKFGFSYINGIAGATELEEAGYQKAVDMGASIEHREYSWSYLSFSISRVYEWKRLFINKFPEIEASIAVGVISNNFSVLTPEFNFTRYTTIPTPESNLTRFNDPLVIAKLQNLTDVILDTIGGFSYISFGNEVNGFFETYFDYTTEAMTNTVMLDDYVNLTEQMYDYVQTNYPTVKVMMSFRNQITSDPINIAAIINRFNDSCDIYSMAGRIFTNDYGFLENLSQDDLVDRFTSFIDLCGSKNFAVTNIYTISDSSAGGSELYQANFIRTLFQLAGDYSDKMEFLCWYHIFDLPRGYLGMLFNPYLEAQRSLGLLTEFGDHKLSYHAWIEEMRALGLIPDYFAPWKIALYSVTLTAIGGFLVFAYVMEGIDIYKKQQEKDATPDEIDFEQKPKEPTKKRKRKSKGTIIFDANYSYDETEESAEEEK
ncbi:MAG: hypothetical protein ACTSQ0_03395 [Candidatus Heimdallarchaeota archaeon]